MLGGAISSTIGQAFISQWGARKETESSQIGRFEAMTKDLASAKQFAILTKEQEDEVEKLAPTIKIPKKEVKKINNAPGGIFKAIKIFFEKEDGTKFKKNAQKPGFFKFMGQVIKENKEYNDYIKTEGEKIKQKSKAFGLNWLVTKEQKSASKVADMLVINEMNDYKNFAYFSDEKENPKPEAQKPAQKDLFKDFIK